MHTYTWDTHLQTYKDVSMSTHTLSCTYVYAHHPYIIVLMILSVIKKTQQASIIDQEALCRRYLRALRINEAWHLTNEIIMTDINLVSDNIVDVLISLLGKHESL